MAQIRLFRSIGKAKNDNFPVLVGFFFFQVSVLLPFNYYFIFPRSEQRRSAQQVSTRIVFCERTRTARGLRTTRVDTTKIQKSSGYILHKTIRSVLEINVDDML